ncbi:unnamed protein product, partial [Symbiodinium sp. KB8]
MAEPVSSKPAKPHRKFGQTLRAAELAAGAPGDGSPSWKELRRQKAAAAELASLSDAERERRLAAERLHFGSDPDMNSADGGDGGRSREGVWGGALTARFGSATGGTAGGSAGAGVGGGADAYFGAVGRSQLFAAYGAVRAEGGVALPMSREVAKDESEDGSDAGSDAGAGRADGPVLVAGRAVDTGRESKVGDGHQSPSQASSLRRAVSRTGGDVVVADGSPMRGDGDDDGDGRTGAAGAGGGGIGGTWGTAVTTAGWRPGSGDGASLGDTRLTERRSILVAEPRATPIKAGRAAAAGA